MVEFSRTCHGNSEIQRLRHIYVAMDNVRYNILARLVVNTCSSL